jgi:conjugal transfer pilus assembly protein TraB
MSDTQKPAGGIFISSKKTAKPASPSGAPAGASSLLSAPKDVKKRWMYVGVGVIGIVIITSTVFGDNKAPVGAARVVPKAMINTDPPNADKDAFTSKFAKDLEAVKVRQAQLDADLAAKDKKILELQTKAPGDLSTPAGVVPPPVQTTGNNGGLGSLGSNPPAPPIPPVRGVSTSTGQLPPVLDLPPTMPGSAAPYPSQDPMVFDAPAIVPKSEETNNSGNLVKTKSEFKKNPQAGLIPAGAFAPIALLNGVDAGTATSTQSNPMPVLMRITDQATLPGSAKYKLKSCFALASAYGDLSAERVYARVSRLSCVDKADRLILSQEVQGYLVDSDGKLGLRGMITDRQGAKVGKALLAGFAQGLAGALGSAQSTVTQNATTGSTSTISGDAALRAAGLAGAQTATSQLAQFYLKEAQAIFPVITVDAGRTGTIVFSQSTPLTWSDSDSQFVQQVTPNTK